MKEIKKYLLLICFALACSLSFAQNNYGNNDAIMKNAELLNDFFNKLSNLEKNKEGKINIVHIGDSHIQADFFTHTIRQMLQDRFGNGGYGFTFPYSLAKTNGTRLIKYKSNVDWISQRNILPNSNVEIGISGISISSDSYQFKIQLTTNELYSFNTFKIFHPQNDFCYGLGLQDSLINNGIIDKGLTILKDKSTFHTVKKGETLSQISRKYNAKVENIKKTNGLRNNNLRIGQRLKIPQKAGNLSSVKNNIPEIILKDTIYLEHELFYSVYKSPDLLDNVYIIPTVKYNEYTLNGIVLEKDEPGLIYHSIGVNGAKTSDFNRYPLFFKQLTLLNPDLIILSFGTNESFGKWPVSEFTYQLNKLIKNIRNEIGDIPILITTPPPSMFKRRIPNTLIEQYRGAILENKDYVIWDMLDKMGGVEALKNKEFTPLIARDKVHYTTEGYKKQGELFGRDFLQVYDNYLKLNQESARDNR